MKSVKVVISFQLCVERVEGLPPSQSVYSLQWSVAKDKGIGHHTGSTKKVLLTDGAAVFNNEVFEVTATMHRTKGTKFESKGLKIVLQEEAGKSGKKIKSNSLGKLVLELADYCNATNADGVCSLSFGGTKLKPPPLLRLRLRAKWLKFDGKLVSADGLKSDGTKREAVEVGGQQVYLMTDQEVSEGSDPDEDKEDPFVKDSGDSSPPTFGGSSEGTSGYTGNALFRTMGGGYETPASGTLPSSFALLEEAKNNAPTSTALAVTAPSTSKSSSASPDNNPFAPSSASAVANKTSSLDKNPFASSVEKQASVAPSSSSSSSSSVATKEAPRVPTQPRDSSLSSNPFGTMSEPKDAQKQQQPSLSSSKESSRSSVVSASKNAGDAAVRQLTAESPKPAIVVDATATPMSPGNQELESLRRDKKSLQDLLEKQHTKIEELRVKMKSTQELSQKLAESEKALAALKASASADRQQLASMEAAFLTQKKRGDELTTQLASEKKKTLDKAAEGSASGDIKKLEAELAASRKLHDDVSQQLASEKKRNQDLFAQLSAAPTKKSVESVAPPADNKAAEEAQKLRTQLDSANRELSTKQLTILDLTSRLKEAEDRAAREAAIPRKESTNPLEGEVVSLKMQIVAMEQDYEAQLEDLRAQLGKSREEGGYSSTLEKSAIEVRSDDVSLSRASGAAGGGVVSRDDYENMMEANRKRVEQLELQLQNALAAATTAASSRVSQGTSQSGDDLSVMRGVEEAVWNAPLEFDDEGVAAAARLIVGVVTENPGTAYAPKLHLALVKAISRSAENQVSLQGKCYWLNVVTQLLHLFSSTSNYGIRSPKDFGIDVSGSVPNTAKSGNMGTFPAQILTLTLTTYQMIVDEIRARVLCPDLVRAIFDPVISAGAKLGSKHHANAGPSVDRYVVELDTALREATAAQLFPAVLRQIFAQIFYDIGAALFNSMLKRPELCSAGRGIEVKLSLASFDGWPSAGWLTMQVREVLRGVSVAGMGPLREACNLFLLDKSDASMIKETCPALNARQLKALLTSFVPDDIAPTACPPKVMGNLTELIKKTDALKIDEKAWLPYQKP